MSELRLIRGLARREALERARSTGFKISTVVVLLVAVAAVALPGLFLGGGPATYQVGLVDTPRRAVAAALPAARPGASTVQLQSFPDRQSALAALREEVDVVVVGGAELVWEGQPIPELAAVVTGTLQRLRLQQLADQLGLAPDQQTRLTAPPDLEISSLSARQDAQRGPRALIATAGMVLLFMSIVFYGSQILISVIEEKQNRVVEILLAHVRPRDLLAGKVLGHGVLSLAQLAAVGVIVTAGLAVTGRTDVPLDAYGAIAHTLLWFVLGYGFYSILYGSLGSLASRVEDAQSAVGPLTILVMGVYFTTFTIIQHPDGAVAVVGSFLPPTAPLMMPLRSALSDVAAWEIAAAVGVEVAALVGLVWLGGRLYRGAVLHIGRRLSLREAWSAAGQ